MSEDQGRSAKREPHGVGGVGLVRGTTRVARGLFDRAAYATCAALALFILLAAPFPANPILRNSQLAFCYLLDLPVAVVSHLTPWHTFDLFFEPGRFGHNNPDAFKLLLLHLRVAIPTYIALFYLPNFVLLAARAVRSLAGRGGARSGDPQL